MQPVVVLLFMAMSFMLGLLTSYEMFPARRPSHAAGGAFSGQDFHGPVAGESEHGLHRLQHDASVHQHEILVNNFNSKAATILNHNQLTFGAEPAADGTTLPPCSTDKGKQARRPLDRSQFNSTVVVTVECLAYHDWQSVVVIKSLQRLQRAHGAGHLHRPQQFRIVRLVSCAQQDKERPAIKALADETHYAPLYSPHPVTKYDFPTLNKPAALVSWLLKGPGRELPDDHELVLTDPDFLFVAPLPLGASKPGRPVGAAYGLRSNFLDKNNRDPEYQQIRSFCPSDDACDGYSAPVSEFLTGPPLFIRVGDLRRILPWWFNVTEGLVLKGDPKKAWGVAGGWLADMYAYSMGAMIERLPHQILPQLFVSNTEATEWGALDGLVRSPVSIHLCQDYDLSKVMENFQFAFNKHDWHEREHVNLLSCDEHDVNRVWRKRGFRMPPELRDGAHPPPVSCTMVSKTSSAEARKERTVWFLWHIYHVISELLAEWRRETCDQ